jgi:hypothetical protein
MLVGLVGLLLLPMDTLIADRPRVDSLPVAVVAAVGLSDTLVAARDTSHRASADLSMGGPRLVSAVASDPWFTVTSADTLIKKKRALVEYSDWYGRRLTLHRTLSWTMLPLFAVSYYTGTRLARDGRSNSPYAVRALHPWAATGAAAVFGVNTVTGLWNVWDARHDPEGRTRRLIHSALFLIADAGFAYAGSIGEQARNDSQIRSRHRAIALSSMGVSTAGWLIMLIGR